MKHPAAPLHKPAPIRKERSILFASLPPGQVPEASDFLGRIERLEVEAHAERLAVEVAYDLNDHSLEELEGALESKGFHLDSTLMSKLIRALIYYVEETQLHNLGAPERLLKKSQNEAYTHAWERHLHGDHDDTPPEWREYK
jgi:hypothetical protein